MNVRLLTIRALLVVALGVLLSVSGASRSDAQPSPTAQPAPEATSAATERRPRLPLISAKGPTTRVKGKIIRSSRGRKGPVRLLIERDDGPRLTALVAPDDYCEEKGLSLREGEPVELEGTMVKSQRPILIATAVIVDGKTIQLRDADGNLIGAGKPRPKPTAGAKASLSGPQPSPQASKSEAGQ